MPAKIYNIGYASIDKLTFFWCHKLCQTLLQELIGAFPLNAEKSLLSSVIVQTVTIDFEAAIWQVIPSVFHGVTMFGCYFHWSQAIWRKVQEFRLQVTYSADNRPTGRSVSCSLFHIYQQSMAQMSNLAHNSFVCVWSLHQNQQWYGRLALQNEQQGQKKDNSPTCCSELGRYHRLWNKILRFKSDGWHSKTFSITLGDACSMPSRPPWLIKRLSSEYCRLEIPRMRC